MGFSSITSIFILFGVLREYNCGINLKTWDMCGCEWVTWEAWQDCDAECNGKRYRSREVRLYASKEGCPFEYSTCATNDMGEEYQSCNNWCHNGGTSDSGNCTCKPGFFGSCCQNQVICGHPGNITNGRIQGTNYAYGQEVTYSCNRGFKLIGGNTKRICQETSFSNSGFWSGTKPRCAYFASCNSMPCKDGATCTNIPDGYECNCEDGWSGKQCTIDVQPPSMSDCQDNINITTTDLELHVNWTEPTFWDKHGNEVNVSSNYPSNSWTFPWGDYTVSYSAIKPSNGLKIDCVFHIKIRPHKCESLKPPLNGAIICNQWKTDYGRVCLDLCHANYTVPRGLFPNQLYVCVSFGLWLPSDDVTKCSVEVRNLPSFDPYNIGFTFTSCHGDLAAMKAMYIRELRKSPFKFLCDKFRDECTENNVSVICQ